MGDGTLVQGTIRAGHGSDSFVAYGELALRGFAAVCFEENVSSA